VKGETGRQGELNRSITVPANGFGPFVHRHGEAGDLWRGAQAAAEAPWNGAGMRIVRSDSPA
jgi:hypothetical protein